jgi:hypothetical protein
MLFRLPFTTKALASCLLSWRLARSPGRCHLFLHFTPEGNISTYFFSLNVLTRLTFSSISFLSRVFDQIACQFQSPCTALTQAVLPAGAILLPEERFCYRYAMEKWGRLYIVSTLNGTKKQR